MITALTSSWVGMYMITNGSRPRIRLDSWT